MDIDHPAIEPAIERLRWILAAMHDGTARTHDGTVWVSRLLLANLSHARARYESACGMGPHAPLSGDLTRLEARLARIALAGAQVWTEVQRAEADADWNAIAALAGSCLERLDGRGPQRLPA
jgi:hypothetical protein